MIRVTTIIKVLTTESPPEIEDLTLIDAIKVFKSSIALVHELYSTRILTKINTDYQSETKIYTGEAQELSLLVKLAAISYGRNADYRTHFSTLQALELPYIGYKGFNPQNQALASLLVPPNSTYFEILCIQPQAKLLEFVEAVCINNIPLYTVIKETKNADPTV